MSTLKVEKIIWGAENGRGSIVEIFPQPKDVPLEMEFQYNRYHCEVSEDLIRELIEERVENKYYPLSWEVVS